MQNLEDWILENFRYYPIYTTVRRNKYPVKYKVCCRYPNSNTTTMPGQMLFVGFHTTEVNIFKITQNEALTT